MNTTDRTIQRLERLEAVTDVFHTALERVHACLTAGDSDGAITALNEGLAEVQRLLQQTPLVGAGR